LKSRNPYHGLTPDSAELCLQAALRDATRDLHHRLDHHSLLAPLLHPTLDIATYGKALQALHAINAPAEAAIAACIQSRHPEFDYRPHCRIQDLEHDLSVLGRPQLAAAWPGPILENDGQLAGNLYVLAGSTMGGRVIYRQLQASLGLNSENGGRFFAGHGEQTMPMWQACMQFAARICTTDSIGVARQSAAELFQNILTLLDQLACHDHE